MIKNKRLGRLDFDLLAGGQFLPSATCRPELLLQSPSPIAALALLAIQHDLTQEQIVAKIESAWQKSRGPILRIYR